MRWAFLSVVLLAGCGGGTTRVLVTVEGARGISGIDHLVVGVVNDGMIAQPVDVTSPNHPFSVAPGAPFTFSLEFDAARSGSVQIDVEALDDGGHSLADGSAHVLLAPGQTASVSVILGGVALDGGPGMADATTPQPDAARADASVSDGGNDQAMADAAPQDGTDDLVAAVDAAPADLTPLPDLASADLSGVTIASITPGYGSSVGGTKIVILGTGFQITPTVTVGGNMAPMVTWNSANKITVVTPAASQNTCGPVDVTVTNPNTLSATAKLFTYSCLDFPASVQVLSAIPSSATLGDLDLDGTTDLVFTVAQGLNQLLPFSGKGDGTFIQKQFLTTGANPTGVAVGDFNGDNNPDLVVTAYDDLKIGTFLGDKTFAFAAQPPSAALGVHPLRIAVADFDGANGPDVAFTSYMGATGVLHGDGAGNLVSPNKANNTAGNGIVSADFNADGYPDIAIADHCKVGVFLNTKAGKATFPQGIAAVSYVADRDPWDLATADLDGNGTLDLVVANNGTANNCGMCGCAAGNDLSVLLGNGNGKGDGTFKAAVQYPVGTNPVGVVIADWNGDGVLDLAAANATDQNVSILLGNGDGTFQAAQTFGNGGKTPQWIGAARLDADAKPDLVLANTDPSFTVLLNGSK
jgi:hypothetical protein